MVGWLVGLFAQAIKAERLPVILLTKKDAVPPMLKGVALHFADLASIALVPNPDDPIREQLGVKAGQKVLTYLLAYLLVFFLSYLLTD